jgi:mono/diheme cytochrome c family protein
MRKLGWFAGGAVAVVMLAAAGGFVFLKTGANGFSARAKPSGLETYLAEMARSVAVPAGVREKRNPIPNSVEVLAEARAHWADHCATCHSNDGSGDTALGRQMYPPAPDMRKQHTQRLTDGELFYIIENGIRLSGMPAWGSGTEKDAQDSWKLVHFIRHLPALSPAEIKEMEKLNPKSPDEWEEERQEAEFLRGQTPGEAPKQHHHH